MTDRLGLAGHRDLNCLSTPAGKLLLESDRTLAKAGGIDLLDLMKEGILEPLRLVNLRAVPGLDQVRLDERDSYDWPVCDVAVVLFTPTVPW